jgi:hypothetical protein
LPSRPNSIGLDSLAARLDRATLVLNIPADLAGALLALVCPERYAPAPPSGPAADAPTGTEARMAQMAQRAARGEELYRPGDETRCGAPPSPERRSARDPALRVRGGRAGL